MNKPHLRKLLSPTETSQILGVTVPTLCVWRCTKRYKLPYVKVGRKVFYEADTVHTFIDKNTHLGEE